MAWRVTSRSSARLVSFSPPAIQNNNLHFLWFQRPADTLRMTTLPWPHVRVLARHSRQILATTESCHDSSQLSIARQNQAFQTRGFVADAPRGSHPGPCDAESETFRGFRCPTGSDKRAEFPVPRFFLDADSEAENDNLVVRRTMDMGQLSSTQFLNDIQI